MQSHSFFGSGGESSSGNPIRVFILDDSKNYQEQIKEFIRAYIRQNITEKAVENIIFKTATNNKVGRAITDEEEFDIYVFDNAINEMSEHGEGCKLAQELSNKFKKDGTLSSKIFFSHTRDRTPDGANIMNGIVDAHLEKGMEGPLALKNINRSPLMKSGIKYLIEIVNGETKSPTLKRKMSSPMASFQNSPMTSPPVSSQREPEIQSPEIPPLSLRK